MTTLLVIGDERTTLKGVLLAANEFEIELVRVRH